MRARRAVLAVLLALPIAGVIVAPPAQAVIGDIDDDGVLDGDDNCPEAPNVDQADGDNDGIGDACDPPEPDPDQDGDGVLDGSDNCVSVSNSGQQNFDNDPEGDACDLDDDNDGFSDAVDAFDFNASEHLDTDLDGVGDNADLDDDDDGVADSSDPFPKDTVEWADADDDGIGDNLDPDDDDDGFADSSGSIVVKVRGRHGITLGAGVATVTACNVATSGCATFAVPASGEMTLTGDPSQSYTIRATAYKIFHTPTLPVTGDMTLLVATAGAPRVITGNVLVNGFVESDAGLSLCFIPPAPSFPNCTPATNLSSGVDSNGDASILANSYVTYLVLRYAESGAVSAGGTAPFTVAPPGPATFTAPNTDFTGRPALTTYTGTVTRTGFSTFGPKQAGVYACPTPMVFPPGSILCVGLRVAFAAPDGTYRLRLGNVLPVSVTPPQPYEFTGWQVGGFMIIDGAPVPGAAFETLGTGGLGDVTDHDFSANVTITPSTSEIVGPVDDPVTVEVGEDTLLHNVASVPASTILTLPPPSTTFAHGIQSFTAELTGASTVATIRLHFDDPIPAGAQWYKLRNGEWVVYPSTIIDPHTLELSIEDGSLGDDDGVVNGFVTDPGALGAPTVPPNSPPSITPFETTIEAEAIGPDGAVVPFVRPIATDPEDGDLDVLCTPEPSTVFPIGTTPVTCTAFDSQGEPASTSTDVIVTDQTVDLVVGDVEVVEGDTGTQTPATITVELSSPLAHQVKVTLSSVAGTATPAADFRHKAGVVVRIPAGATSATVSWNVYGDNHDELDETFSVMLSAPVGVTLTDDEVTVKILDDDGPAILSVVGSSVIEGNGRPFAHAHARFEVSSLVQRDITIGWRAVAGTADRNDVKLRSGTVVLRARQSEVRAPMDIVGDHIVEGDEWFTVEIVSVTVGAGTGQVTFGALSAETTIIDDDAPPDRVPEAIAVSEFLFPVGSDVAVLTSPDHRYTAIAGSLAGALGVPMLVNPSGSSLDPRVASELARLGVDDVRIVGGTDQVSSELADEVALMATVTRLGGPDPVATAAIVAADAEDLIGGSLYDAQTTAVLVSDAGFADAFGAPMLAATLGAPLLLTDAAGLSSATSAHLTGSAIEDVFVIGGTAAIGESVTDDLAGLGLIVDRVAGITRFGTAAAVAAVTFGITPRDAADNTTNGSFTVFLDLGLDLPITAHASAAHARFGGAVLLEAGGFLPGDTEDALVAINDARALPTTLYCALDVPAATCAAAHELLNGPFLE